MLIHFLLMILFLMLLLEVILFLGVAAVSIPVDGVVFGVVLSGSCVVLGYEVVSGYVIFMEMLVSVIILLVVMLCWW